MLAYILAVLVVLVGALVAFGIGALLHLQGLMYVIFVVLILVLAVVAAVAILVVHHRAKKQRAFEDAATGEAQSDLELLLKDADRKLRNSQQGARTLQYLPLVYILGDSGSAKTTTVIKSGLEPELLAGAMSSDAGPTPTTVLNVWFTRPAALLEIGSAVRQSSTLLSRLVHRTRAKAYRAAFGTGTPPRCAIVCLSMDQLLTGDASESLLASARTTNAELREISRILGMPIPVYVIVTKLDRVKYFDQYVRNLSDAEIAQTFGSPLTRADGSVGTYADQTSRLVSAAIDSLVYRLGEFRVEMLARENDGSSVPAVYEFPREFGKLRKNLNQYLVELCKPSQLSANPYLRGFYFTGVRARIVERAAPVIQEQRETNDAGATRFMNLAMAQPAAAAAVPVATSTRIPQWTFLPHLLPDVILKDKTALAFTRQSAPARLFRRILFASLAFLFALYAALLAVSYVNNADFERRIADAAHALPRAGADANALPGLSELKALESLRQVIVQLDEYQKNGAPLRYRFGLYLGDELDGQARSIYFDRFRPLLLNPAQSNFVAYMRSLPDAPQATTDFNSYLTAYRDLKAYLITTSHPEKSQSKFLTPIFLQYWIGSRQVDADEQQLAQKQIDFYGDELLRQPPYTIDPEALLVSHTQIYLSKFLAETRIYENMLTDADKAANPVDFNKQYPDAVRFVSDGHVVRGALTRTGFDFMQNAFLHPEKYAQGETWVLGEQSGQSLNLAGITKDLSAQYSLDFMKEWHAFLLDAHIAGCGSLKTAPSLLNALSGPSSPLLELFFTVSSNTAVNDTLIRSTFQPVQALVDSKATDRLISGGNGPYISALSQLATVLNGALAQNPNLSTDPAGFAPVAQQVTAADAAARQLWQTFNVDKQWHTENTVLALLEEPIHCIAGLAPSPGAQAAAGGRKLCSAISPLLAKFPFALNATAQASLQEADAVFAPDTGILWQTYNTELKSFLAQAGPVYVAATSAPQPLNPRFVNYFNRAARLSATLYPAGAKSATLTFNLRFIPGNGITSATFAVDGQRIPAGAASQQFTWTGASAQHASLIANEQELPFQGTWAIFQLVRAAQITHVSPGVYRLDYPINNQTTVAGHTVSGTTSSARATFELSGPGAEFLVGEGFNGLNCVPALGGK